MASIGENLKAIRSQKHVTQAELARRIQVNPSMIAQIERGTKAFNLELAKHAAEALGCSVEDFIR